MVKCAPKVLIVEDDPIVQFIHKRMFLKLHCDVDLAKTGQEALDKLPSDYDLIFLDLGLPDKYGIDLIGEMLYQKKLSENTRVIVITAQQDPKLREQCLAMGAEKVLYKPVNIDDLDEAIYTSVDV